MPAQRLTKSVIRQEAAKVRRRRASIVQNIVSANAQVHEQALLLRACREIVIPSLHGEDIKILGGILREVCAADQG